MGVKPTPKRAGQMNPAKCDELDFTRFMIVAQRSFTRTGAARCQPEDAQASSRDAFTGLLTRHSPAGHGKSAWIYQAPTHRLRNLGLRGPHYAGQYPTHHQHRGTPLRLRRLQQHTLRPGVLYRANLHPGPVAHPKDAASAQEWIPGGPRRPGSGSRAGLGNGDPADQDLRVRIS
jgi:hypothetical protein